MNTPEETVSHYPKVQNLRMTGNKLLRLEILEGTIEPRGQVPYEPMEGDYFRTEDRDVLAWENGKPAMVPKRVTVLREIDGRIQFRGILLKESGMLWLPEKYEVVELDEAALDNPGSYLIHPGNGSGPMTPLAVHRKSKPVDHVMYSRDMVVRHTLYLELPERLPDGMAIRVSFPGLELPEETVEHRIDIDQSHSEAIHVSQVGYRPDDPYKRALLSLWLGTGGAYSYDRYIGKPFFLVDEADGSRHRGGEVRKLRDASEGEAVFSNPANHAQTHLYALDFSDFRRPGRYRILIEGIGSSYPFEIRQDSWRHAFRISMQGFLHHRSGIALDGSTGYVRPLTFHPEMGIKLLQTDVTTLEGEIDVVLESLSRIAETTTEEPEAWGGYMDAGDWDRRSQHLSASYLHLELFELFPGYFSALSLDVPADEAANGLPDLIDEALWNLEFYQRIQLPDGGVRGGVESTEHPRQGEASWQESLLVGVFAPDAVSSYRFVAVAAKAARVLEGFDEEKAKGLRESAVKAWKWAQANEVVPEKRPERLELTRTLAAIELYWLSGDQSCHEVFKAAGLFADNPDMWRANEDALFTYARLPDELADPELTQGAREILLELGRAALRFQEGNAFDLATPAPNLPIMGYVGFFTVPGMISRILPRAHYLTGEERYLEAIVAACNFANGANPANLCYTTGLGSHYPLNPLHIDHRVTAQHVPAGITVYGPSDPAEEWHFNNWVHRDYLAHTTTPDSRSWPAAEAYFDFFTWPAQSEYTVHQTLGPTSYHWGYLAARK